MTISAETEIGKAGGEKNELKVKRRPHNAGQGFYMTPLTVVTERKKMDAK
jgi:hypothetical protein